MLPVRSTYTEPPLNTVIWLVRNASRVSPGSGLHRCTIPLKRGGSAGRVPFSNGITIATGWNTPAESSGN